MFICFEGFTAHVKEVIEQGYFFIYFLHRRNCASQRLLPDLQAVAQELVQVGNFINAGFLN